MLVEDTPLPVTRSFVTLLSTSACASGPLRLVSLASASTMAPATMGEAMLVPLLKPVAPFSTVDCTVLPGAQTRTHAP